MKMNAKRKYINQIKHHLLYVGSKEKKFLKTLSIEIEHFSTDKTTYHDLVQNFGEPEVLANYYLEEYDEFTLRRKIKQKKMINVMIVIILIAVFIILILYFMNYINANDSFINREFEIITEN